MLRNLMLGGVSFRPLYRPDDGSGSGVSNAGQGGTQDGTTGGTTQGAGQQTGTQQTGQGTQTQSAQQGGTQQQAGTLASGDQRGAQGTQQTTQAQGTQQQPGKFAVPDDWREQLAGEDAGFLAQLKRHTSFDSAMKWLRTTSLKVTAGELKEVKPPPAAGAKPEEVAAWRKEQGLPETAEAFVKELKLPDGVVLGDADKALVDSFAKRALGGRMDQQTFNDAVAWWFDTQGELTAQRAEADETHRTEAQQQLIEQMGADYKPNMIALTSLWAEAPPGIQDIILTARTADGRVVGDMPEVVTYLAGLARELNPAATVLPAGEAGNLASIEARIAEIDKVKYVDGKPNPAYFNGPLYAEYQALLDAQAKLKPKAA